MYFELMIILPTLQYKIPYWRIEKFLACSFPHVPLFIMIMVINVHLIQMRIKNSDKRLRWSFL